MITVGGRELFERPLSFDPAIVNIGDETTIVDPTSVKSVAIGLNNTVGHNSQQATVVGYNNTVSDNAPNCTLVGQMNAVSGDNTDTLIVLGYSNTVPSMTRTTVIGHFNALDVHQEGSGDSVVIGNYNKGYFGLSFVIGYRVTLPFGSGSIIAMGAEITVANGKGGVGGILIGNGSTLTANTSIGIAIGVDASAGDNQCVIGDSDPTQIYNTIHQFIVRGITGIIATGFTAIDTLNVIDNPTDGSSGLTVVYNSGGTFTNKTLKASVSPPSGALIAYFTS